MYAQLGPIVFQGLKGFDAFSSKKASNIAQHALIDGKPRLQKVGDELEEITLSIQFHSSFCNPESEIAVLEENRANGSILPFINGAGELFGTYVITEHETVVKHTNPLGQIILCTVSVTLLEVYDQDPEATEAALAKRTAFANAANTPSSRDHIDQLQGAGLSSMSSLAESRSQAVAAGQYINNANSIGAQHDDQLSRAETALNKSKDAMTKFQGKAALIQDELNNYATLAANIANTLTYTEDTLAAVAADDLPAALVAHSNLTTAMLGVTGASTSIVSLTATRRI